MEVKTVLRIWLGEVPEYTSVFVCLTLVICLIDSVSNPFMTASAATGRVKLYQSVVGAILVSILPIAYIVLKLGATPSSVFIVHLCIGILAFIARLLIVRDLINLSIRDYMFNVISPCTKVLITSILMACLVGKISSSTIFISLLKMSVLVLIVATLSFLLGLSKRERNYIVLRMKDLTNAAVRIIK